VDLVHKVVDWTWGWFSVNQGRQWRTACRCAALPELWFTGPRRKGPRSKRASWGPRVGGHRTMGGGGIGRHRRMVAAAFGAHRRRAWTRRRGDGVGVAAVEYCEVRGPFYRAGGWEGRRCGEGNGR
jgi:hypothetical protein